MNKGLLTARGRFVSGIVALTLLLGAITLTQVASAPAGAAASPRSLMFLLDGSGSIDGADWDLQKEGYRAALSDRLAFPLDGSWAVGVVQWSSGGDPDTRIEVPLTVLSDQAAVDGVISKIDAIEQLGSLTNPGDGIRTGTDHLVSKGRGGDWILCMSTDGSINSGEAMAPAVAHAVAAGVDRYSVVAIEDGTFDDASAQAAYGPYVFGGGSVTTARNTAEFASLILSGCLNPALKVTGIEVNQAVQDWTNSVPLIADKSTFVRVFVETPDATQVRTTGRLHGTRGGSALPGSPLAAINPGSSIQAGLDASSRRGDLNSSLNFQLPPSWLAGDVTLRVELPGGAVCAEASPPANDCRAEVSFDPQDALDLRVMAVRHDLGGGVVDSPTTTELIEQAVRTRQAFPIADVDISLGTLPGLVDDSGDPLTTINNRLALMRFLDLCFFGCDRYYYGAVSGGTDLGGLAEGIPGAVSSGTIDPAADRATGGYTRNRGPHEVAHTLGRHHAVNSSIPSSAGAKVGWCNEVADDSAPDFPYSEVVGGKRQATLGPLGDPQTEVWGIEPRFVRSAQPDLAVVNPRSTFELMSYCKTGASGQTRWPSKFTYEGLIPALDRAPAQAPASVTSPSGTYYVVRGTIDLGAGSARLDPSVLAQSATPIDGPAPGPYSAELLDSGGAVIDSTTFAPAIMDADLPESGDSGEGPVGQFIVPFANPDTEIAKIVVRSGGTAIATLEASATAPTVTVTEPGAITGDTASFAWTAADADGDALTSTVQYSADGGNTWKTIAVDLTSSDLQIDTNTLGGSADARLRVITSDGLRVAVDTSEPFTVENRAPIVSIQSPESNQTYAGVQLVSLDAVGVDPEGTLPDSAFQWSSSLDGSIGTGPSIAVDASTLTEGTHVMTATATDAQGASGSDTVTVIIERVSGPIDTVTANAGGPYTGTVGVPITFDGSGSSAGVTSYRWDFDGDGTYDVTSPQPTTAHTYGAPFAGSVKLEVTSPQGTATATAPVTVTSGTTPDPTAGAALAFVKAAYSDFLGRAPSSEELVTTSDALVSGRTTRADVVEKLAMSPEWVSATVRRMYVDTLGRSEDANGLRFWSDRIRSGRMSVAQVASFFYSSSEYFDRLGGGTVPTWVEDLYKKLLGRPSDAAGAAHWVDAAKKGRIPVAYTFFQSRESRGARVDRLYRSLLGRPSEAAGRTFWVPRILTEGDIALAADLAASPEYNNRAQIRFPS